MMAQQMMGDIASKATPEAVKAVSGAAQQAQE